MSGELEAILNGKPNVRIQTKSDHDLGMELAQRLLYTVGSMLGDNAFNSWHMSVKQRQHWERLRLAFKQYNEWLRKGSEFERPRD
jgi:hypothetical protein